VEVWENEKCCGNTSQQVSVSTAFSLYLVLSNFHECFYDVKETWRTCSGLPQVRKWSQKKISSRSPGKVWEIYFESGEIDILKKSQGKWK